MLVLTTVLSRTDDVATGSLTTVGAPVVGPVTVGLGSVTDSLVSTGALLVVVVRVVSTSGFSSEAVVVVTAAAVVVVGALTPHAVKKVGSYVSVPV